MFEVALITARGGSVALPRKNVLPLGGVPLINWTIRAARDSGLFKRVVVSTDDLEIARISVAGGAEVPFMRPAELATSEAQSSDVVVHALASLGVSGAFALLQPTSPFRSASHLIEAARLFDDRRHFPLVSVAACKPVAWQWQLDMDRTLSPLAGITADVHRRQDSATIVTPNGAIYFHLAEKFVRAPRFLGAGVSAYPMGSIDSIDIDDRDDFELARAIVEAGLRTPPV